MRYISKDSRPLTVRQLLTHTSGLVYDIWNADVARWHEVTGKPTILSLEKESLLAPLASAQDPGAAADAARAHHAGRGPAILGRWRRTPADGWTPR